MQIEMVWGNLLTRLMQTTLTVGTMKVSTFQYKIIGIILILEFNFHTLNIIIF